MKRKTAAIIIVALLTCILSGCQSELNEMKANQAFWTDNGDIQYGDLLYKKLPDDYADSEYLSCECSGGYIYVTDRDVPVLLASEYGSYYKISDNKLFMCPAYYEKLFTNTEYSTNLYCLAEKYDDAVLHLKEGYKPDSYCYTFYILDEKHNQVSKTIDLTDLQVKAFEEIRSGEPLDDGDNLVFEHNTAIKSCTSDKLMEKVEYYIKMSDNNFYLVNDYRYSNEECYIVPDKYKNIAEQIMRPVIEADAAMKDFNKNSEEIIYPEFEPVM